MLSFIFGILFTFGSSIYCATQGIFITNHPFGLILVLILFQRAGYILGEDLDNIFKKE